ncbi:ribulokinase [Hymenobacter sp. BT770]|uniref:ribulokinase n=1 Tax=Hymenobacter sp. BT770 TaxID=2886942 RepID=UPI001D11E88A|nr:ribulokinase [Hymenobacter sp. BT770]MCC3154409.1 ribulokinase [Hymenobacter sp. BT770]MDO3416280.1 ribulokinase [Hymenobacter sp. BT770]
MEQQAATPAYVIGVDYGTDSVRAVLIDARTGAEKAQAVHHYARWKTLQYCNPARNQFRQHPLDYIEGLEAVVRRVAQQVPAAQIAGLAVDTTGSTPGPVNAQGVALGLLPEFAENPNAQFVLWKDHTALDEAAEINHKARTWGGEDYTKFEGGIYSSEWFWAKIMHVLREDAAVAQAAYSWMEHCDWITLLLTGGDLASFKRSRCAAGHKAMWHESWGGLPSEAFLTHLEPKLAGLRDRLFTETYTADEVAGRLSEEWAQRLGLTTDTVVAVGSFDAHAGAVAGEIEAYSMVKVMGTSTCDIVVAPTAEVGSHLVAGICGQVDGSVIPGMLGLEAGQSAFGDLLAWFRQILEWPLHNVLSSSKVLTPELQAALRDEMSDTLLVQLSAAAAAVDPAESHVLALDWVNGRRTPDANQALKGAIMNLTMGSNAPQIFRALVEAICYGSKQIVERFEQEGIAIKQVIGIGGVAKKSQFVMQTLADVLNRPIKIAVSEQAPALGSAMYAAVAAGLYPDVLTAQKAMGSGFAETYQPNPARVADYQARYKQYQAFGQFVEATTIGQPEPVMEPETPAITTA